MLRTVNGHTFGIVYNGELYNSHELKQDLIQLGYAFETCCDTEIILNGYLEYGTDFVTRMNGIFAFAILDPVQDCLFLFRDRMGVKPLFYTVLKDQIVFSSEIKGLFAFPGITPRLGKRGLNEIFSLGPARTPAAACLKTSMRSCPARISAAAEPTCTPSVTGSWKAAPTQTARKRPLRKPRFWYRMPSAARSYRMFPSAPSSPAV